jgi:hypothetical protein
VAFYVGPILVGEVKIWTYCTEEAETSTVDHPETQATAGVYQAIFPSYSHTDTEIVQHLEKAYTVLGMQSLRDVHTLRSGEECSNSRSGERRRRRGQGSAKVSARRRRAGLVALSSGCIACLAHPVVPCWVLLRVSDCARRGAALGEGPGELSGPAGVNRPLRTSGGVFEIDLEQVAPTLHQDRVHQHPQRVP